jgi:hypothetical protein
MDDKSAHYLDEARRCREIAAKMDDEIIAVQLRMIADQYEVLARQVSNIVDFPPRRPR